MDEHALIGLVKDAFGALVAGPAFSLEDDAAALPPTAPGRVRVVTTDLVVEGVDFDRSLYPVAYAGARALAQNLSDVSAMGADAAGFLWSFALPAAWLDDDAALFSDFVHGAAALAKTRSVSLYGGDLSSTPASAPLVCSVTCFGDVEGFPVRRAGARLGDDVYLSSPVGAAAAGLRRLRQGDAPVRDRAAFDAWLRKLGDADAHAVRAHLKPLPPRGAPLAGHATACIDVSDGLALDASRLASASACALELDALAAGVDVAAGATVEDALAGGEDYALLFTLPSAAEPPLEGAVRIGRVVEGEGVWHEGARLAARGFDHFASTAR